MGISKQLGFWISSVPARFRQAGGGVTPWKSCRHEDECTISSPMHMNTWGEGRGECSTGLDAFPEAQEDPRKGEE